MEYDLGNFDEQTCNLEPLPNPFRPKMSPMSTVLTKQGYIDLNLSYRAKPARTSRMLPTVWYT